MATDRDDSFGTIERLLGEIMRECPKSKRSVSEIRRLLKTIGTKPISTGPRQTGGATSYSIYGTGMEALLAEQRPFAQPMRVSRRTYDGIVAVLERADRALGFEEVMLEAAQGDHPPAEWQVRVVLRFLIRKPTSVLVRERSRYRAVDRQKLRSAANKLWTEHLSRDE